MNGRMDLGSLHQIGRTALYVLGQVPSRGQEVRRRGLEFRNRLNQESVLDNYVVGPSPTRRTS